MPYRDQVFAMSAPSFDQMDIDKELLVHRLDADGVVHQLVEVVRRHVGENGVDGFTQLIVALHHGNADVDILCALFFGELEVAVRAGEVKDDHVGVGLNGALGGRHIGADEVDHAGLQRHQHGGSALGCGLNLGIGDLREALVVPDGGFLRGADAAGKVGDGGGGSIVAAFKRYADHGGVEVRTCEVDLLGALGRHGLAGDDGVIDAGLHAGDEGIPVRLDDLKLPAVGLADLLGDHDVVAVGISAGNVADGNGAVAVVALAPVVGSVGAFKGDGKNAVFHTGGDGLLRGNGDRAKGEHQNKCNQKGSDLSHDKVPFKKYFTAPFYVNAGPPAKTTKNRDAVKRSDSKHVLPKDTRILNSAPQGQSPS